VVLQAQGNKCFGFNTKTQTFVLFSIEPLLPYQTDRESMEIVKNLQQINFATNFTFNGLIEKQNPVVLLFAEGLIQTVEKIGVSKLVFTVDIELVG
jgi:hypothetical protein